MPPVLPAGPPTAVPPRRWAEVPALGVRVVCELLREQDIDPAPLLRAVRIPIRVLSVPDSRVGGGQEILLQHAFAAATAFEPRVWKLTGRRFSSAMFGSYGLAMLTAPTLRDWRRLVTTQDTFYSVGVYRPCDSLSPAETGLQMDLPPGLEPAGVFARFTVWRDVFAVVGVLDEIWGPGPFPLLRVEVPHSAGPAPCRDLPLRRMSGGDGTVRWIWARSHLDTPLPKADPFLHVLHVERSRRSEDWLPAAGNLKDQVASILGRPGRAGSSLEEVATELSLSARTLQRRLAEDQIGFRDLRDSVRLREAERLLETTDIPIARIAEVSGYSDVASFSNAFRRRMGARPSEFRDSVPNAGSL